MDVARFLINILHTPADNTTLHSIPVELQFMVFLPQIPILSIENDLALLDVLLCCSVYGASNNVCAPTSKC